MSGGSGEKGQDQLGNEHLKQQRKVNTGGGFGAKGKAAGAVRGQMSYTSLSCGSVSVLLSALQVV